MGGLEEAAVVLRSAGRICRRDTGCGERERLRAIPAPRQSRGNPSHDGDYANTRRICFASCDRPERPCRLTTCGLPQSSCSTNRSCTAGAPTSTPFRRFRASELPGEGWPPGPPRPSGGSARSGRHLRWARCPSWTSRRSTAGLRPGPRSVEGKEGRRSKRDELLRRGLDLFRVLPPALPADQTSLTLGCSGRDFLS